MRWRRGTWIVAVALLVPGLALRLLLLHFRAAVSGDSLVYGDIATNLLHHRGYALSVDGVVRPTLIRLPGYPLFLASCFLLFGDGNFPAVVAVQIFLDLAGCVLLSLLASRLMGRSAGFWALLLTVLCPFTANYSIVPLTESLAIFCIILGLFSFERWVAAARAGRRWNAWLFALTAVMTLSELLRPDRALLCAVFVIAILYTVLKDGIYPLTRSLLPIGTIVAVMLLPLLLWGVRNWQVFHVLQPLSPKYANDPGDEVALGFMRWYRTWGIDYKNTVEVYWPYDGSTLRFADIPARAFDSPEQRRVTEEVVAKYNDETGSTPNLDAAFAELAAERIRRHPVRYYVLLPLARLGDMWLQPRTELLKMPLDWWSLERNGWKSAFSLFYCLLNAIFLVLAAFGARNWRRHAYSKCFTIAGAMFAFILLRSALLATLDNAEQRYTIDCYPMILLLASFAFARSRSNVEPGSPSC